MFTLFMSISAIIEMASLAGFLGVTVESALFRTIVIDLVSPQTCPLGVVLTTE